MTTELSKMIKEFEGKSGTYDARLSQCEEIHARFLKRWPREMLSDLLTLKSYAIGAGDHDNFCYWVERETRPLGSILGASSSKFKVYYSPKKQAYEYVNPFQSAKEAFEATKAEILRLLDAAERDDMDTIKTSKLFAHSHMFRGKILHLYFPKKFICVFSEEDIDYFLDRLGISLDPKEHVIDKKMKLSAYKYDSPHFSSWPSRTFVHFLYDQFIPPSRAKASGDSKPSQTDADLRKQEGHFVLPNVDDVELELVGIGDLSIKSTHKGRGKGKTNYIAEAVRNTKLGNHGEDLIMEYEKAKLRASKEKNLAKKVQRVSIKDDSLGYDILSFYPTGEEKYIEVKSTTGSVHANTPFYLSENERQKMVEMGNKYFIYRLMAANTRTPKLLVLGASELEEQCELKTKLWQVSFVPPI